MTVSVNGAERELAEGSTFAQLLGELGIDLRGIAVARNDEVVRRADLDRERISSGDRIEIIKAVAGG
ncbi:MAG: sulfur carrier protein ThiS [Candidatus Eremiobacteraeota bacterium]|nr:sulfur carrier protein ThiS [Candidatus Eremiobacteraeota bacterium]